MMPATCQQSCRLHSSIKPVRDDHVYSPTSPTCPPPPPTCLPQIWRDTEVSAKNPVPTWLLAVGGAAIVLGLATCECCWEGWCGWAGGERQKGAAAGRLWAHVCLASRALPHAAA